MADAARRTGVSRQTAGERLRRRRMGEPMSDRSSRPRRLAGLAPPETERRVAGASAPVPLAPLGLAAAPGRRRPRHRRGPRPGPVTRIRYERRRPGELLHVDVKKVARIPDGGGWRALGRGGDPYGGIRAPDPRACKYFGIGNAQGIWVITTVFLACMAVFCLGAVLCGLSGGVVGASLLEVSSGFAVLLAGRMLQAIGACGVIPLANAEIGSSAPPEKRGFALGITAATSGIANVLGAGVGSAVIGAVGQENWPILFYACLPFGILAIAVGIFVLPKGERGPTGKIDVLGSAAMVAAVFLLLLWIQSVTEERGSSPLSASPLVPAALLAGTALSVAVLAAAERRSPDPILDPRFFTSPPMLITLAISFFIGAMTNSMTLVPEFAEAALGLDAGMGGTYMVVIGAFSMAGPPLGGRLIDRFGAKPVLVSGLAVATLGYLFLALATSTLPNVATLITDLTLLGFDLGFCMGVLVELHDVRKRAPGEVNSALGTSMLVHQIAISVSPAPYISFVTIGTGAPLLFAAAPSSAIALAIAVPCRKGGQR